MTPIWWLPRTTPGARALMGPLPHSCLHATLFENLYQDPRFGISFPIQALLFHCLLTLTRYVSEGKEELLFFFFPIQLWAGELHYFKSHLQGGLTSAGTACCGLSTGVMRMPAAPCIISAPGHGALGSLASGWGHGYRRRPGSSPPASLPSPALPRGSQTLQPRPSQPSCNQGLSLFHTLCQWFVKRCDMFLPNAQQATIHPWAARTHFTWSMKNPRSWGMKNSTPDEYKPVKHF